MVIIVTNAYSKKGGAYQLGNIIKSGGEGTIFHVIGKDKYLCYINKLSELFIFKSDIYSISFGKNSLMIIRFLYFNKS